MISKSFDSVWVFRRATGALLGRTRGLDAPLPFFAPKVLLALKPPPLRSIPPDCFGPLHVLAPGLAELGRALPPA